MHKISWKWKGNRTVASIALLVFCIAVNADDGSRTDTRQKRKSHDVRWPHICKYSMRGIQISSIPVIYECEPQMQLAFVKSLSDWDPDSRISNAVPVETPEIDNATKRPDKTPATRNLRDMYALVNATFQFDVPGNVTVLRLWHQRIVSVEEFAFMGLRRLDVLNLQQNHISYLALGAFKGLPKLTELDLSYNRLQFIPSRVFMELGNLDTLSIRHNELSRIQDATFCGLNALSVLDLSHNAIEDIGPHALQHFRSAYSVTMEFGHNRLRTPRKEWIAHSRTDGNDSMCKDNLGRIAGSDVKSPKSFKNKEEHAGMEIQLVQDSNQVAGKPHATKFVLPPIRMFRASHNPWSCTCDSKLCPLQFLRHYKSLVTSQFSGEKIGDVNAIFREFERNSSSNTYRSQKHSLQGHSQNITDPRRYTKWYLTMPCNTNGLFRGVDIGRLSTQQHENIEKTCCLLLTSNRIGKRILTEDETLGRLCRSEDTNRSWELTESHVTIIGIVIVFCTPILLTLCPDCNRTVTPSSAGGMVSGGKFGAMSINNSNNTTGTIRTGGFRAGACPPEKRPQANTDMFCLVAETENKSSKTFYNDELV